jgi:hypothetical protein
MPAIDLLIQRLPAPAQARRVNLHEAIDARLTGLQQAHYGFRDGTVLRTAQRLGVPSPAVDAFRLVHTSVFDRVYDGLHAAHWHL